MLESLVVIGEVTLLSLHKLAPPHTFKVSATTCAYGTFASSTDLFALICFICKTGNFIVGIDTDDLLDEGKTDQNGHFELKGYTHEITTIDPKLNIYHDCEDGLKVCYLSSLYTLLAFRRMMCCVRK